MFIAMTKKLFIILAISYLTSCAVWMSEEAEKSGRSAASSQRINASESNSQGTFKELDE